jgi:hypothetical protein
MQVPSKTTVELFKKTPGAISVCEMFAIYNIALQAPSGAFMELGSHAGKSGISAAHGLGWRDFMPQHPLPRGDFYMVDPCYDLSNVEAWANAVQKKPENMPWPYVNEPDFKQKVANRIRTASAGYITPVLLGDYSVNAIPKFNKYGYVFVDSDDHQIELVMAEVQLLEDRMVEDGIIAFHDYGNQYHAPRDAYDYLVKTGKFSPLHIPWDEIRKHVSENDLETGNDSWHMTEDALPCFVGAVKRNSYK